MNEENYLGLPASTWLGLYEVEELIESLGMSPDEIRDGLIGILGALEATRPGYLQIFLSTVLNNRWRKQATAEEESG